MPKFLARHALPPRDPREALTRLAHEAGAQGVRAVETFLAPGAQAFTLYEAPDVASVERVHERAGVTPPDDVVPVERVFTELLAQPHRAR